MPKAFLLKYKKRCEYFGRHSDEADICRDKTEAIDLETDIKAYKEHLSITGRKSYDGSLDKIHSRLRSPIK